MEFLNFLIRAVLILAALVLMAFPFLLEAITYKLDAANKISYKRFRLVVFTLLYVTVVTVVLFLFKELFLWFESTALVKWMASSFAVDARISYCVKIIAAMFVNIAISFGFFFLGRLVSAGLKKKNLTDPGEDGSFSWSQRAEIAVIRFFHTETWFFVARIVKGIALTLSLAYAAVFTLYQIPAYFGAEWIPYDFISALFGAGYIYPVLTLLPLWEVYFFLKGIERVEEECPELLEEDLLALRTQSIDLEAIDREIHTQFGAFYSCDVKLSSDALGDIAVSEHHNITRLIAAAVENDSRNPHAEKEIYLNCLDEIVESDKSVLINGGFFTEFSAYFLRYLSVIVARGDNVAFVCNGDAEIDSVYDYLRKGFSQISSLYCESPMGLDFDDPVWRIVKIGEKQKNADDTSVDDSSILVTSLDYLCSTRFESEHESFIKLLDTVVFVSTLDTMNKHSRQLSMLNTRLKNITKSGAALAKNGDINKSFKTRYMSRQVRYICFGDTRVAGLDRVLKNTLSVDFVTSDIMRYSSRTIIRCYNYEARVDENGRRSCPQVINSKEELGAIINVALTCLLKGAGCVNVFVDDSIPYEAITETISSNSGRFLIKADGSNIKLNKHQYNPDDYSVIIAMDTGDNLPATVRRYASMVSDKPALIFIFSRPYMLRDYYVDNIETLWGNGQIMRIPVIENADRDVAQKILAKANAGGISEKEILSYAADSKRCRTYVDKGDVDGVLRTVLEICGEKSQRRLRLFDYFEYVSTKSFDENGAYISEDRVMLRRQGTLFDIINGRDSVILATDEESFTLPIPRDRLTHNFIAGQNVLYNGNIYTLKSIDVPAGKLYAKLAVGGNNNEAYRYLQCREYRIEASTKLYEQAFRTKQRSIGYSDADIEIKDVRIAAFRAPMEVITSGYYEFDPHTMSPNLGITDYHRIDSPDDDILARQTYRRYGKLTAPYYSFEKSVADIDPICRESGALVMHISIAGSFGEDVRRTSILAAAVLNEILHSMFPSVADAIVVCPALAEQFTDEESESILRKQPRLTVVGENDMISYRGIELLIIEDSDSDLGVVSVLMSSGDNVLQTLFEPVFEYLKWYSVTAASDKYLHYGLDHEPSCFDFATLERTASVLGDDKHDTKFINVDSIVEYEICDFCGKRHVKGGGIVELEDGRRMCSECAQSLVGNNKKVLKSHLDRAKLFLENNYGISLDDGYEFCFESTVKIANTLKQKRHLIKRGADIPLKSYIEDKKVHVEYSLPSVNLSELLVRELTYVWQLKNAPNIPEDIAEGHIALVAIQYLRYLNQHSLANVRTGYYESFNGISGDGYRKLVRELVSNPRYKNNPFRYVLEAYSPDGTVIPPPPKPEKIEDTGLPYVPAAPDRVLGGRPEYFWYPRLSPSDQSVYDEILNAIRNYETFVGLSETPKDAIRLTDAVMFDHPELFACSYYYADGSGLHLKYGATPEEAAALQARIDDAVIPYLEGITDSMSAYDVAISLHAKLVNTVDYDTIALDKEENDGRDTDKIDYLRSICGVFLEGRAVCEGYARALQYLLQQCGVLCAEAAGHTLDEQGNFDGGHAWNILRVDGDYYYMDVTWDDSSKTVQEVKNTHLGFDYFCITTEELLRTRALDMCPVEPPECTATKANYYYHNNLVLDKYDLKRIEEIAKTAATSKQKSMTFKLKSKAVYQEAYANLIADNADVASILKTAAKADKSISRTRYVPDYDSNIRTITIKFSKEQ